MLFGDEEGKGLDDLNVFGCHHVKDLLVVASLVDSKDTAFFGKRAGKGQGIFHESLGGVACLDEHFAFCQLSSPGSAAGEIEVMELVVGKSFFNKSEHAGEEGDAQVHLGEAEVAAVGAHEAEVAGAGEDGSVAESVAIDGGYGGYGQGEELFEDIVHAVHESFDVIEFAIGKRATHPLNIHALGKGLGICGGENDGGDFGVLNGLIEAAVQLLGKDQVLCVGAVIHRDNCGAVLFLPCYNRHDNPRYAL